MTPAIDGCNFFYTGWIARLLCLPPICPGHDALKPEHRLAFKEGYDVCDETDAAMRHVVLELEIQRKNIRSFWIDDEGDEFEI